MKILSVAEMRALEEQADAAGHSYDHMMELAGEGVARAILERTSMKGRRALVLVGPGNNGGDGLVAARYLSDAGVRVTAYLARPRSAEDDPVFARALEHNVNIVSRPDEAEGEELQVLAGKAHLVIDALLGTGATPPLRGVIAEIVETTQAALQARNHHPLTALTDPTTSILSRPLVVAVDGPSGMDFDTGEVDERALTAQMTVTFATPKQGQFRFPAAAHLGTLIVADIGIPETVTVDAERPEVVTPTMVQAWLPQRPDNAHKGTFGKAIIVAGSVNYTGAAGLAALSAVRAGAGLVTLGLAGSLHDSIVPLAPEVTYVLLPEVLGAITADALRVLNDTLPDYDALLVGPGLGQAPETADFLRCLFGLKPEKRGAGFVGMSTGKDAQPTALPPLVIDADGLNLLAKIEDWPALLPSATVLTPHPGELSRLTGKSISEIETERWTVATECAAAWEAVVVLKGAFTVVAAPDGRTVILPFANAGLASAGTGDVLAGTIVALRAQGVEAFEAAAAGVYLHGLAGALTKEEKGTAGMSALDVAKALPRAYQSLEA